MALLRDDSMIRQEVQSLKEHREGGFNANDYNLSIAIYHAHQQMFVHPHLSSLELSFTFFSFCIQVSSAPVYQMVVINSIVHSSSSLSCINVPALRSMKSSVLRSLTKQSWSWWSSPLCARLATFKIIGARSFTWTRHTDKAQMFSNCRVVMVSNGVCVISHYTVLLEIKDQRSRGICSVPFHLIWYLTARGVHLKDERSSSSHLSLLLFALTHSCSNPQSWVTTLFSCSCQKSTIKRSLCSSPNGVLMPREFSFSVHVR